MRQNILIKYIQWHFFDASKNILKAWRNFILFNLNYFSIFLLIKTFFSHWRKYRWTYPRGFSVGKYLETLFSNLISRIFGAIFRTALIFIGLLTEIFVIFGGAAVFLGWLVLPAALIIGLYFGVKITFF